MSRSISLIGDKESRAIADAVHAPPLTQRIVITLDWQMRQFNVAIEFLTEPEQAQLIADALSALPVDGFTTQSTPPQDVSM